MKPVLRGFLTTAKPVKPMHSNQATSRSGYIIATSTRMLTLLGMCLVEMEYGIVAVSVSTPATAAAAHRLNTSAIQGTTSANKPETTAQKKACLACSLYGGQQEPHQDGDEDNDHEQLD